MLSWLKNKFAKKSLENSNFRGNDDDELPAELEHIAMDSENQVSNQEGNDNNNAAGGKKKKKKKKKKGKEDEEPQKMKPIIVLPACCGNGGNMGAAGSGMNHPFLQAPMANNFNPLHCLACCCNNSNAYATSQPPQPFYPPAYLHHTCNNSFHNNYPTPHPSYFNNNATNNDDNITKLNEIQEVEDAERKVKMRSILGSLEHFFSKLSRCKQKLKNFDLKNSNIGERLP